MEGRLAGKVALVTGGARGIGAATAKALAVEGALVAITYLASADRAEAVVRSIEQAGGRAACFQSDQADPGNAERLVAKVIARFGTLDILVNNAALFASVVVGDEITEPALLDQLYDTNLHGVIAMIRAAAGVMKEGGRVISMSSNVAVRAGHPGFADYTATKAGLTGYSKAAARDLGPRGITVNVVQVGPTITEMNPDDTELAKVLKTWSALGRYGRPEEIAAAVVFMASPDSSYITGTVLEVDGGVNA
jgi:3-oxoacyl-[acyl-carrier protein] reductase